MKRILLGLVTASLVAGSQFSPALAQNKAAKEVLDDRVEEVNRSSRQRGEDVSLKRIATETGVSLEEVKSLHKKHDNVGIAGLMIACVLSNETRKEPGTFLKQRANGKSWSALARENNVPLEKLNSRLDRLDAAIGEKPNRDDRENRRKRDN
jgi:hypothetical protein